MQADGQDSIALSGSHIMFMFQPSAAPTAGQYDLTWDYNDTSTQPAIMVIYIHNMTINMDMTFTYEKAFMCYNGTFDVASTGDIGAYFSASALDAQMIEVMLVDQGGGNMAIQAMPEGRKALMQLGHLECGIASYPPGMGDICM